MVGEQLKKRREELGKDLRDISEKLKIKYDYLKAIEEGDDKRLPAEVYVKGYICDYARFLNLDSDEILSEYNKEKAPKIKETETKHELIRKKTSKMPLIIIALAILTTILIVSKSGIIINPKSRDLNQDKTPLTGLVTKESKHNISPEVSQPLIKESLPKEHNKGITPPEENKTQHELEIIANDTTWLLIVTDNTESKEYLLKSGESIKCTARKNFSLKIGNAGGIRLIFNGKDHTNLGQKGQVVKLVLPENSS